MTDQQSTPGSMSQPGQTPIVDTRVLTLDKDTFDIYIRMNMSAENDFCFQVDDKKTFRDLFEIFSTIPYVFSPSIFYDRVPIGFHVSHFPGHLTRTGTILFEQEGFEKKYLKKVTNLDAKVSDLCLPGQLLVPIFRERTFLHSSVIAFIIAWLYTDLPEFISPTPGICFTYWFTDAACYVMSEYLNIPDRALKFYNDVHEETSVIGQCIYFVFHIFKVALFYFILWAGSFNPYSFTRRPLPELSRENLLKVGWTGAKRTQKLKFQDAYRKFMISKYGTIMELFKNGKLSMVKHCFITLQEGEGYDSSSPVSDIIEHPYKIDKELLLKERAEFSKQLSEMPYVVAWEELKKYRSIGQLQPSATIEKMVTERFASHDAEILKNDMIINPLTTAALRASSEKAEKED